MFSHHASSWPQPGQAERGVTIERFSGRRATTTFRKLPSASAAEEASAASAAFGFIYSTSQPSCVSACTASSRNTVGLVHGGKAVGPRIQRIDAQSGHGVDLALDHVLVAAVDGAHRHDLAALLPRGADGQLLFGGAAWGAGSYRRVVDGLRDRLAVDVALERGVDALVADEDEHRRAPSRKGYSAAATSAISLGSKTSIATKPAPLMSAPAARASTIESVSSCAPGA